MLYAYIHYMSPKFKGFTLWDRDTMVVAINAIVFGWAHGSASTAFAPQIHHLPRVRCWFHYSLQSISHWHLLFVGSKPHSMWLMHPAQILHQLIKWIFCPREADTHVLTNPTWLVDFSNLEAMKNRESAQTVCCMLLDLYKLASTPI